MEAASRARGLSAVMLAALCSATLACSGSVGEASSPQPSPPATSTPSSNPVAPSSTPVLNPGQLPTYTPPAGGTSSPATPSTPSTPLSTVPTSPTTPLPPTTPSAPVATPTTPSAPVGPVGPALPAPAIRVSEAELPQGVREILERRCTSCHTYGERDPAGWGSALDVSRMIDAGIVVPGDPDNSRLYNRVAVRADMPFNGARLTGGEVQVMRAWIANLPRPAAPAPRTDKQVLDLLVTDMAGNRSTDTRYLSFAQFFDEHRAPEEMKAAQQVLALVLNSLSRKAALVAPEAVDPNRTIFRFRLSALGWSARDWDELVSFYPYCLHSDDAKHVALYNRIGSESPVVRADWFVATATKPPLYQRLLQLPDNLNDLAADLNVDIEDDLNHPRESKPTKVARIGFRSSGVSAHNRIIDRHTRAGGGYMWVSYDFNADDDRSDIRANPLGPQSVDARNFTHTFVPAGGEIIWTLPNGLYGYMLVDATGRSLDLAAKEIVRDLRRPGGAVQNGISCFGCHGITGMNRPRVFDDITTFVDEHKNQYSSQEVNEVHALYPSNGSELLTTDADRYLKATDAVGITRAVSGVVEYDDFINLVGGYEGKLGLRGAALELAVSEAAARALVQSGRNEDALPLSLSDPLVTRNDFVCRFRSLASRNLRNARFCAGTFTAPEVQATCQ
jgi:mono/diheme cytochrome c family protein